MSETIDLAALTAANAANGDSLLGINGNSLKKAKMGNFNGNVCSLYDFPKRGALVSGGYMDDESDDIVSYAKGILKYLVAKHSGGGIFVGIGVPSTQGIMIAHIYAGGASPNGSGLPQHGTLVYFSPFGCYFFSVITGTLKSKVFSTASM